MNNNTNSGQTPHNDNQNNYNKDGLDTQLSPLDSVKTKTAKLVDHSSENKLPTPDKASQQISASASVNNMNQGGRLELLEERPVVNKERLDVGKVTVTKHTRTKTINVPIELIEEYITVETQYSDEDSKALLVGNYDDQDIVKYVNPTLASHAVVTINGNKVQLGDAPIEIVISRQVAVITKDTHVIQDVEISKTTHVHTDTIPVTLQHEKLEVFEEGFLDHKSGR